jgi:hypothetical protein
MLALSAQLRAAAWQMPEHAPSPPDKDDAHPDQRARRAHDGADAE